MALAILGPLGKVCAFRLVSLAAGAVLPLALIALGSLSSLGLWLSGVLLLASELAERFLFFSAAPSLRMPGNLR
jgi:DMSO reductase anchor subunit